MLAFDGDAATCCTRQASVPDLQVFKDDSEGCCRRDGKGKVVGCECVGNNSRKERVLRGESHICRNQCTRRNRWIGRRIEGSIEGNHTCACTQDGQGSINRWLILGNLNHIGRNNRDGTRCRLDGKANGCRWRRWRRARWVGRAWTRLDQILDQNDEGNQKEE